MSENKKESKLMDNLFKLPFLKKLKNIKHIEIYVCIIFISLLLVIYFINFSPQKTSKTSSVESSNTNEIGFVSSLEYSKNLEDKLKTVLSNLNGVKNVQVLVSVSSGGEIVIANNVEEKTSFEDDGKKVTVIKTPIIVTENGTSKPIILMEVLPKVNGVIVVASGAEDVNVKLNIYKAIEAIISIPSENIQVFAGK